MTNYAYIRVSTDKQEHDNQRHGVIEYAKRRGLEPISFFDDTASGRKNWQERDIVKLLDSAKSGDALIAAEVSRLARSTKQVLDILEVAAKKGVTVHIAKEGLVMDGTMISTVMATVLGLFAHIEAAFISARTKEALARRKAQGLPVGRRLGSKNKDRKLDKHREQIVGMLQKGVHKTSIARILGCDPNTLYGWLEDNGFGGYIKSRKGEPGTKQIATASGPKKGGDAGGKLGVSVLSDPRRGGKKTGTEGGRHGKRS